LIRIQLAPADETDEKWWFLPDLLTFVLVGLVTWYSVDLYLENYRQKIQTLSEDLKQSNLDYRTLAGDLERFSNLEADINRLKDKIKAIQGITISKISRYKPIILFEHLQTLKPEGVWFTYVKDNSENNKIFIVAKAFDNILVAEFMSLLNSTKLQSPDPTDIRSLVYFDDVYLERVSSIGGPVNQVGQTSDQQTPALTGYWTSGSNLFPELSRLPTFQLTIKYDDRSPESESTSIMEL
jgi:Tfp pilus assembly protein PilN